jgi:hypothetical protein
MTIEEILKESYLIGSPYKGDDSYDVDWSDNAGKSLLGELQSHEQSACEEAVEDFVRYASNKLLHDSINDSYEYPMEEVPNLLSTLLDEFKKQLVEKDKKE